MAAPCIEVMAPGLLTMVQDEVGRLGYWMVGVPPSGAFDSRSLRLANRVVGNTDRAAGLECTVMGPTLRFVGPAVVALGGADMGATLDGREVPRWAPLEVAAGSVLELGAVRGPGLRCYVAIRGGIDVPEVLGSRATFDLGRFGGVGGRALAAGDRLSAGDFRSGLVPSPAPRSIQPELTTEWTLTVMEGPHSAPEFFTPDGLEELLAATWTVQSHAARTGVRLDGPTPQWARRDGGEAGLHPSNIHDNGYAFGAVDFTGDTPVVLGPDGPSLGGFTCPLTVVSTDRWKVGQLAPGNSVRFRVNTSAGVDAEREAVDREVSTLRPVTRRGASPPGPIRCGGVLGRQPGSGGGPRTVYRQAGDEFVLIEFGDMLLDLELRARVYALEDWLMRQDLDAIVDLTPGVRSLLVHLDTTQMSVPELLEVAQRGNREIPPASELEIPSRIVHLPLSWEDPATLEAISRYMATVRDDAPWCPSNIEFIRRANGLSSIDELRRIVFEASYLVLGLGDVYLGAPVATPLDPRHRLVTTKYNPARTWTPENAVGIGGAYLCVYGMEGPGGYQFVGRTVPVWYLDTPTPGPEPDVPWLLRTFDQIRFHEVSAAELTDLRARARAGQLEVRIEETTFSLAEHLAWLDSESDSIEEFRTGQQAALAAERQRWEASGELR